MANHPKVLQSISLLYVCFAFVVSAQAPSAPDRNRATFVIGGKVQKIEVVQGQQVATVSVSTSLRTPAATGSLENEYVKVVTRKDSEKIKVGNTYTFYAVGGSGGKELSVREISRLEGLPPDIQFTALQPAVAARYLDADLVVRAEVSSQTDPPTLNGGDGSGNDNEPPSEHAPNYKTWTLKIDDVLKGSVPGKSIHALVATNPDIAYVGTGEEPKPTTAGETKVIALRWDSRLNSFVAVDQIDVRPLSEMPAIQETVTPSQPKKPKN